MTEHGGWQPPPGLRWTAGAIALALVGLLFHQGAQPYAVGLIPSPWDKLAHVALFGVIAALSWLMTGGRRPWASVAIAVIIGVADEAAQWALPGRRPGWDDLLADALGAGLVVWMLGRWARRAGTGSEGR